MRKSHWPLLFLLISGLLLQGLFCTAQAAGESEPYPSFPPVMTLDGLVDMYTDARGSVVDQAAENKNKDLCAGVDKFMGYLAKTLDNPNAKPGDPMSDCAYANFHKWAEAGALTVEPKVYNRGGTMKRGQYLVGLNIYALKFRAAGYDIDPMILSWLRNLNYKNMNYYQHGSNRGNLYNWSGASTALFALLDNDQKAIDYQNQVWRVAMSSIKPDGTIDGEMARGHRALIYHMFSFSATLVQRGAREALGYKESAADRDQLQLLADEIGRTLRDPKVMEIPAQATQEIPGIWAYRIPIGFGHDLLNDDWIHYGKMQVDLSDQASGGNTQHTSNILKQLSQKH